MVQTVFDVEERRRRLAVRHLLDPAQRVDDPAQIADALVCLHSSDPVTVFLSAALRMASPSIPAVQQALYRDFRLIRQHAMRRTIWVFTPQTARIAHACATMPLVEKERNRMVQLLEEQGGVKDGVNWMNQATQQVIALLHEQGETDTKSLGQSLPHFRLVFDLAPGKPYATTQSALARLMFLLGMEGRLVRGEPAGGSWISSQYQWAVMTDRYPEGITGADPEQAEVELARLWLSRFGPAPETDLRWWTGWTATQSRRSLKKAGAVEVNMEGTTGWVNRDDLQTTPPVTPWVALLPGLDPTTMGWKSKDWYMNPEYASRLFDRNGNAGPTIWVNSQIVGGWVQRPDGTIAMRLLEDVGTEQQQAINQAAHHLETLIGPVRFKVRFPAPLQKQLLA